MKRSGKSHTGRAGFTLVELLVVLGIIALLAALAVGVSQSLRAKGRADRTRTLIEKVETGLVEYKETIGTWPPALGTTASATDYADLARVLLEMEAVEPSDVKGGVIVDAWGHQLYALIGGFASPAPDVWSPGPNGVSERGADPNSYGDDIVNWARE